MVLSGCSASLALPDGGRDRVNCSGGPSSIPVTAQDAMGMPLAGATVAALNTSNGQMQTSTTGGDGRTLGITDALGRARSSSRHLPRPQTTRPFMVQIVCGECDCTVIPSNATLTLQ